MLPSPEHPPRPAFRRLLAASVSALLLAAGLGLGGALPASAADAPSVSATDVPPGGGEVTVTGSGFAAASPGIYLGVGPAGLPGFYLGAASLVSDQTIWIAPGNADGSSGMGRTAPLGADGSFEVTVTVPALTDEIPEYTLYTSKAHGQGMSDPSQDTQTALVTATIPAQTTLGSSEPLAVTDATLAVSGTGFSTAGPGVYVGVGPRSALDQADWFVNAEYYTGVSWVRTIEADGTFQTELTGLNAVFSSNGTEVDCREVECGVVTFAAHGSADRSQDTYTAVSFAADPTTPTDPAATATITTLEAASSSTEGDELALAVTVAPAAPGTIAVFDGTTPVAQNVALENGVAQASVSALAVGSHSLTAVFTPADATQFAGSTSAVLAHLVEAEVTEPPVTEPPTTEPPTTEPGATVPPATNVPAAAAEEAKCVARDVSGASLDWGVKTSFRNYISGGIAKGSWNLDGIGYEGGQFTWAGGTGAFNTEADKGLVSYGGSLHFSGHGGILNVTLSNVKIQVESASSATLLATVVSSDMEGTETNHGSVAFASIALDGAAASGNSLEVSGAPAALTPAGAEAFAGFYEAGTALDPVSFTFPLGADTACTTATGSGLASTGVDATAVLGAVAVLILAGFGATVVARRRAGAAH